MRPSLFIPTLRRIPRHRSRSRSQGVQQSGPARQRVADLGEHSAGGPRSISYSATASTSCASARYIQIGQHPDGNR
jgi:hypothetical protein